MLATEQLFACDYFEVHATEKGAEYRIAATPPGTAQSLALFSLVKALIPNAPLSRRVSASQFRMALGKLRAAIITLSNYNTNISVELGTDLEADNAKRYANHHAAELFSVLGFQPPNTSTPVEIPGLFELVSYIEKHHNDLIESHRAAIAQGNVEFEGLGELFTPGRIVAGPTSLGMGVVAAFKVVSSWFEEKRTLFGMEQCFRMRLEVLVPFGKYYSLIQFEEVYSGWTGAKVKTLEDLGVAIPVPEGSELEATLSARGLKCAQILATPPEGDPNSPPFLQYTASSFIIHGNSKRSALVPSVKSGRIVIDSERGLMLGHFPAQGSDEVTLAIMNAGNRYKRILSDQGGSKAASGNAQPPVSDSMLLYNQPPASMYAVIWPAVVGFSFAVKAWGHVLVDALSPIQFNDDAFNQLVVAPERKKLIKALVRFGGKTTTAKFDDIVAGKSGGSVFLLHGAPGTGKTLTAEAISELLHKPLYYVTMGELGTNPEEMEKRLGTVLELCSGWDALTIIDEADVFLEKRQSASSAGGSDVVRNAMVCVMLRLLEYHEGILFLTTNRVLEFDPAFESRVTVALRYDSLDASARQQVWRNLIGKLKGIEVSAEIDYEKLSEPVLNGRQIKNAVRLALALAEDDQSMLTHDLIEQTLAITSIGRDEMQKEKAASVYLLLASYFQRFPSNYKPVKENNGIPQEHVGLAFQAHMISLIVFSVSLVGIVNTPRIPFTAEGAYLLTTLLAGLSLLYLHVYPAIFDNLSPAYLVKFTRAGKASLIAAAAAVLGSVAVGLPVELYTCNLRLEQQDMFNANGKHLSGWDVGFAEVGLMHLFFVGCGIAYLAMLVFVLKGTMKLEEAHAKQE
ncbi:hypothetical protein CcCBS67573_g02474 [Chytriomyces confervae]|uniref:AAA+ ATPase domain-containing protein n=1 Tax=Chytriomyces confervae TaxID=246404 RepID=A0A507FJ02_9FUNG|nr:hypothetical protein CcCBS67573_g02474 [Chytriomyces confervae]